MLPLPGPRCFPLSCPGELSLCSHTSQVLPSDPRASHSRSFQGCHLSGRGLPCVLGSRKGLWEKMVRSPRCVLCPGFRPEGHLGLVCAGSVQEAASLCPLSPAWSLQEVALLVPCTARALGRGDCPPAVPSWTRHWAARELREDRLCVQAVTTSSPSVLCPPQAAPRGDSADPCPSAAVAVSRGA